MADTWDDLKAMKNTDRELWREKDDYYAPSIFVTEAGGIGISVNGTTVVMSVRAWMDLARRRNEPQLGCATTQHLIAELHCRAMHAVSLHPDYRTIDTDEIIKARMDPYHDEGNATNHRVSQCGPECKERA